MTVVRAQDDKPFVKIVFDGVVAVGPGRPPDDSEQMGPFFALMARSTRRLSNRTQRLRRERALAAKLGKAKEEGPEEEPFFVHMHVPTIFTRLKPAEGSRPPDQILQLSPLHECWYLWHPIRERLEFWIGGDATPGKLEYPTGSLTFPSDKGHDLSEKELSFRGIEHVPDLREIWPERSVLRDGLLSSDPAVDQRVMTQVLVPSGTVVAAGVLEQGEPRKVRFEPVRKSASHDAVVPGSAIIVRGTSVEIASFSLDTGERLDTIKFDAPDGGEIWMSNGDPSDAEMDMEQVSMQLLQRSVDRDDGKLSEKALHYFSEMLGQQLDAKRAMDIAKVFVPFHHSHRIGLHKFFRSLQHTGEFDLDFELFYTLMKNEHLMEDDLGVPVPRHVENAEGEGPDCYDCVCSTNDKLEYKSKSPR